MNAHAYFHTDKNTELRIYRATDGGLAVTLDDVASASIFMSDELATRLAHALLAEVDAAADMQLTHETEPEAAAALKGTG